MHGPLCSWPLALPRPRETLNKMAEQSELSGLPPHSFLHDASPGLLIGHEPGEDLEAAWVSRPTGMEHGGQGKRGRGGGLNWASSQDHPGGGREVWRGGTCSDFQGYQRPRDQHEPFTESANTSEHFWRPRYHGDQWSERRAALPAVGSQWCCLKESWDLGGSRAPAGLGAQGLRHLRLLHPKPGPAPPRSR